MHLFPTYFQHYRADVSIQHLFMGLLFCLPTLTLQRSQLVQHLCISSLVGSPGSMTDLA